MAFGRVADRARGKEAKGEVAHWPPGPELADPELHLDQSSRDDSQPVDFQAPIYAEKGKAKESLSISGTARDVGSAA